MNFHIAQTEGQRLEIKRLAYQCYVQELKWSPEPSNASNFRVVENREGNYLDDDFASEATYFAYSQNSRVIAGGRFIRGTFSQLEISRYPTGKIPDYGNETIVEINRICIRREYLNTPVLPLMFNEVLIHLNEKHLGSRVLTTVAFPTPGDLFCKLGFQKDSEPFTYGKNDFEPVSVITLDISNPDVVRKISNIIGNLYGSQP